MTDARIITGNQAAALAARLCDVQVVAAYPITPQSQLAEILSQYVESGQLRAEYVRVEGEHSAMTVCIGASTVGARVFTATSSNGLLYMHEQLHWAAGSRLPIVMCCVNRGVGAPWSIFNDQQDSLAQRDTGWVQMYCRDNQEILDTVIQAYKIAETVYAPVMVCYDGFVLSHTMMPVVTPSQAAVRKFLPPYKPHTILDANNPMTINSVLLPNQRPDSEGVLRDGYMEMRCKLQSALDKTPETIREVNRQYAEAFGRDHGGMLWTHRTEDAEVILSSMGSLAAEATVAADALREEGIRAGAVGIRVYRPFPDKEVVEVYRRAKAIILFEKSISYGYEGGLCSDLKAAFYGSGISAVIHDHVAGLGGRDVKARELVAAVKASLARSQAGERELKTTWLNCATE
ncbi:MAG TPA: transketolase C-terminal domain-containing protein [Syntrophales bacterium]|nr:transketolase C-terminal domain-containing protein [Syntrophales bacterium]